MNFSGPHDPAPAQEGATADAREGKRSSLLVTVPLLLTIALLPLGLLSVMQTQKAFRAAQQASLSSLRAWTTAIARPERESLMVAASELESLAEALAVLNLPTEACTQLMENVAASTDNALFVGLIDRSQRTECNNLGRNLRFLKTPGSLDEERGTERSIEFYPADDPTGLPVTLLSHPVIGTGDTVTGHVTMSIYSSMLSDSFPDQDLPEAVVITFNQNGDVLNASQNRDTIEAYLPRDTSLASLASSAQQEFRAPSVGGATREYVVEPILAGSAYMLGSWEPRAPYQSGGLSRVLTMVLPLLMWGSTLLIALLAMQWQVVAPLRRLGHDMRGFSQARTAFQMDQLRDAPREVFDIGHTFGRVADDVARNEANLQSRLNERTVLLREVHHRVRNNLQMISSVINMQMRKSPSSEVHAALRAVQDRLVSLDTIYHRLYQSEEVSNVRADLLLEDLFTQLLKIDRDRSHQLRFKAALDPVTLGPDRAGVLAMLAAELFMRAIEHARPTSDDRPAIQIEFRANGDEVAASPTATLEMTSHGDPAASAEQAERGIGDQLIRAFALPLDAEVQSGTVDGIYSARVTFGIATPQ